MHKCISYSMFKSKREMNRFPQIFYSKQRFYSKIRLIIIGFWHKENIGHKFRKRYYAEEMEFAFTSFVFKSKSLHYVTAT